jgi:hypothetical protein
VTDFFQYHVRKGNNRHHCFIGSVAGPYPYRRPRIAPNQANPLNIDHMKRLGRSPRNFKSRQLPSAGALLLIVIYVTTVIGCSYYKVNTIDPLSNEAIIEQVKRKKKYIILHYEEEAWHLKDITLDDASQELKGTLEALPPNHMYYKTAKGEKKANRYKSAKEWQDRPVYEVHIYLSSLPPILLNEQSSSV